MLTSKIFDPVTSESSALFDAQDAGTAVNRRHSSASGRFPTASCKSIPKSFCSRPARGLLTLITDRKEQTDYENVKRSRRILVHAGQRAIRMLSVMELNHSNEKSWMDVILKEIPEDKKIKIADMGTGPGFFRH